MKQTPVARHVTKLLLLLGFSPRHFGFGYIREMILIAFDSDNKTLSRVYAAISAAHNQPVEAVQTAVRTALHAAQTQACFNHLDALYGVRVFEPSYILAPKEFLGIMLEYLNYIWDGSSEFVATSPKLLKQ